MGLKPTTTRPSVRNTTPLIPPSGVARYTFDDADTESGTALDVWNGNDATINGAVTGVSGANQTYTTNEAYSFDGTTNVSTPLADPGVPFSVAVWAKWDVADGDAENAVSTRTSDNGFGLRKTNGGFEPFIRESGSFRLVSGPSVSGGVWYHVAITVGAGTFEAYVDGNSVGSSTYGSYVTGGDVSVGDNGVDNNMVGDIDDVRIYSKALTSEEVSSLYNNGAI